MILENPKYEIIEQEPTIEGMFKQIELAGRTCYKSEDKITIDSAKKFVQKLIECKHFAMLEHGTIYLKMPANAPELNELSIIHNPWIVINKVEEKDNTWYAIITNYRLLIEHFSTKYIEDLLQNYFCKPTEHHAKRRTVKLTTSLHVYKDLTRHRKMSFAIESTRYCNYSKSKFGKELTFIRPIWCDSIENDELLETDIEFYSSLAAIEKCYMNLIENGWKPQCAAEILPQCIKADVVITGFEHDWEWMFKVRADGITGKPHPEVERIMIPIARDLREKRMMEHVC